MFSANPPRPTGPRPAETIPPLEPGDRLTRDEFERRYHAMPNLRKAELIEGVVYLPSPVRLRRHGNPNFHLAGWLAAYEAATPGVIGAENTTIRLDVDNEPQPDAMLLIDPARGGQARITDDDYVEAAPEWVGEVSSSSASFDLHTKFHVYRRNRVREYVIWRVPDREVDWFFFDAGTFQRLPADTDGILRSRVFPGLWLDAAALVADDFAKVLAVLQAGLAAPEHAQFVQGLQSPTLP